MPKPKIPNCRKANLEHKKRVEKYAVLIQQVYDKIAQQASLVTSLSDPDSGKPFSFSEYPLAKEAFKNLQSQLISEVSGIIMSGTSSEWKESNLVQDLVAKKVLTAYTGTNRFGEEYSRYFLTNPEALTAFQQRKDEGMNLSTRVWSLSEQYKSELEESITAAIAPGMPAMELAAQVKQYLKEPDKRFRRIKEKMEDGTIKWHLSKPAKAYHPGQGVYRSSARNAQRLARTEINMAYRTAEQERWKQFDFVVGYEVKTTQNGHHIEDICDQLAGKYPKDFVFKGWHPQCMCYTIPILKTEDEFWNYDPENPQKSAKEVTELPPNFREWINDNRDRIESAEKRGKLPYFIRDNREEVEDILNPKPLTETSFNGRLPLPNLPKNPSQEEIQNFINVLANNEGWFEQYENGVSVILDDKLRGASASADREKRIIYIKPSESVFNAFHRVSNGEELTFENANNLATLWHEINHMRHIGIDKAVGGPYKGGIGSSSMELANEYYSRKTLPQFFRALGYEEMPFPNMVNRRNTGYNKMVELYDYVVKRKLRLDEEGVLKRIEYGLFNEPYNNQVAVLMDALKSGGLRAKDTQIEKLLLKMCQYGKEPTPTKLDEFINKMKYTVEYPLNPHYGSAMKLGRSATKEAMKVVENIGAPELSDIQKKNIRELADALGIPRKEIKPMSFLDADHGASNPTKNESNCQSCVVAFSARRRGLNCFAKAYDERDPSKEALQLGERFQDGWLNPKTGEPLQPTILRGRNDEEIIAKLKRTLSQQGEYVLGINGRNGEGHVINVIYHNGKIIIHDEQAIRESNRYRDLNSFMDIDYIEIIRIDKALLNIDLIKGVLNHYRISHGHD